jgi:hypothetical protein
VARLVLEDRLAMEDRLVPERRSVQEMIRTIHILNCGFEE